MPEIGRLTDFPGVRILFVERFAIDYQIRDNVILIIDIYSCQTDPEERAFQKQWPAEKMKGTWQEWEKNEEESETEVIAKTCPSDWLKRVCKDLKAAYPNINWKEGKLLNHASKDDMKKWMESNL